MDYENLADARKIQEYVTNMRPTFNKRAVFSDETENYRTPAEPMPNDTVTIRIRTKKNNVDFVFLVYDQVRQQMELSETKDGFDYYSTTIHVEKESIHYFFEIISGRFIVITIKWVSFVKMTSIIISGLCGISDTGLGQRRSYVSDFCRSFLQW